MGNQAPTDGSDLIFPTPQTGTQQTANHDAAAPTTFNSITINATDYDLTGTSIDLTSGITANYTGISTFALDAALSAAPTPITVGSGAVLDVTGSLSGSVGVNLSGGGTLDFSGQESYSGVTTVGSGTTAVVNGTLAGDVQLNGGVLMGNGTVNTINSVGGQVAAGEFRTGRADRLGTRRKSHWARGDSRQRLADVDDPRRHHPGQRDHRILPARRLGGAERGDGGLVDTWECHAECHPRHGLHAQPGDQLTIVSNRTGAPSSGRSPGCPRARP